MISSMSSSSNFSVALPLLVGVLLGWSLHPLGNRLLEERNITRMRGHISLRLDETREADRSASGAAQDAPPCVAASCNCSKAASADEAAASSSNTPSQSPALAFASYVYPTWPRQQQPAQAALPDPPAEPAAAVDPGVLWGYSPLLHPRALQRGLLQHGDPARMRRFVAKLLKGEPIVVAAVGGSISVGRGAANQAGIDTDWPSYLDQFTQWLQAAFPASKPRLVNAAQSGTSSSMFESCAEMLVPPDADLVVAEFVLNDGTMAQCAVDDRGRTDQGSIPARAAYERLLRKLQALPHRPAVVAVQTYSFIRGSAGTFHKSAENDMDVFAAYYGLPVLSVRASMYHLMAQNQPGYRVDMVRSDNKGSTHPTDLFFWDISHPYGPTGHRYMAELLIGLTQLTAGSLELRPLQPEEEAIAAEHLPPPMLPKNYQKKAASCLLSKSFKGAVTKSRGFVWINERPDAKSANDEKWGWVGTTPGAWVELVFDSRATSNAAESDLGPEDQILPVAQQAAKDILDAFNGKRPPVTVPLDLQALNSSSSSSVATSSSNGTAGLSQVLLGHLSSYQGMGQASVQCRAGCSCNSTTIDGHWRKQASLQVMHSFMVTEAASCRVRVTTLKASSSGADGHKVKLTALVVLAGGTRELLSQPGRLEAVTHSAAAQQGGR